MNHDMIPLDPWESYNLQDGRRVVILDDDKRTTFMFGPDLAPKYIVLTDNGASFVNDPSVANLNETDTLWSVFVYD